MTREKKSDGAARRLRALEEHREGTQFKPLDPDSRTVQVLLALPESLRDAVDAAAAAEGVPRAEWIRRALTLRLDREAG